MEQVHFEYSTADPCIYIRTVDVMAIIDVDDLIVIAKTGEEFTRYKEMSIASQF